jgi:peptide deformylase
MIVTDRALLEVISKDTSVEECKELSVFDRLAHELVNSPIKGCGLAAIQIGYALRANLMATDTRVYRMVNASIVNVYEPCMHAGEGCLSEPNQKKYTTDRFNKCTVKYTSYDDGKEYTEDFEGFYATVIQHELDHFEGILNYKREHIFTTKQGRNALCACNSGKKYKKCCINKE